MCLSRIRHLPPVGTAFAVEELADALPSDLDVQAAEERALQQRPDLSQARMQLTLAEAELSGRTGDRERLLATMTATMMTVTGRDDVRN